MIKHCVVLLLPVLITLASHAQVFDLTSDQPCRDDRDTGRDAAHQGAQLFAGHAPDPTLGPSAGSEMTAELTCAR